MNKNKYNIALLDEAFENIVLCEFASEQVKHAVRTSLRALHGDTLPSDVLRHESEKTGLAPDVGAVLCGFSALMRSMGL